jgi:hypothetical protein
MMDGHLPPGPGEATLMVLRSVPPERERLARAMTASGVAAPGGRWWEWVDAAADDGLPATAVALTRLEPHDRVTISALAAGPAGDVACGELLQALLAALRGRAVDTVLMRATDPQLVRALLAAGFAPDPGADHGYALAL